MHVNMHLGFLQIVPMLVIASDRRLYSKVLSLEHCIFHIYVIRIMSSRSHEHFAFKIGKLIVNLGCFQKVEPCSDIS